MKDVHETIYREASMIGNPHIGKRITVYDGGEEIVYEVKEITEKGMAKLVPVSEG